MKSNVSQKQIDKGHANREREGKKGGQEKRAKLYILCYYITAIILYVVIGEQAYDLGAHSVAPTVTREQYSFRAMMFCC